MADKTADGLDEVWDDWKEAVTMTASELERWLDTDRSQEVGDSSSGGESTGHRSGRRTVTILQKKKAELTSDDVAHMRTVVGYVHRHTAQKPKDWQGSTWEASLKNWGHDPAKT